MYCIDCGAQIPVGSKFCPHCGKQQIQVEASVKDENIKQKIGEIIEEYDKKEFDKRERIFTFLKKIMGWYLAWVFIHLGVLLIFSDSIFDGNYRFWPFANGYGLGVYDIREFFVYTIFPLAFLIIWSLVTPIEPTKSKDIKPTKPKENKPNIVKPISQDEKPPYISRYHKELQLSDGRILQFINDSESTEVRINHKSAEDGLYRLAGAEIAYEIERGRIKMEYYIEKFKQKNGQIIEVGGSRIYGISKGSPVWINGNHKSAKDGLYRGLYRLAGAEIAYEIERGRIKMGYYIEKFKQKNGQIIEVGGNRTNGITKGSPVWINGNQAPNGKYKKGWFSTIEVINGRIK